MNKSKLFDQNEVKEIVNELEGFGLSSKEAQVYFALLPRRDTGSSKLVQATGLHKQFVYNALDRLEQMGLARHVIARGRRKYSATTPKRLLAIAEERKIAAQSMATKLQSWYSGAHEQDFEVIQGEDAFLAYQLSIIERTPAGSEILVVSGPNDKYFSLLTQEGIAEEFEQKRIEKNISVRYIGPAEKREAFKEMENWRTLWQYRIFPGLSTGLVDMGVWPDSVILNIYGNPLLSFVIASKAVSDGYREFFEGIWSASQK